jgi:transposase
MSLQLKEIPSVPDETARVARAAFPKGNAWLSLRDELGTIYSDEMFVGLYPSRGQPAEAPWRLALVLVMQFADGLSDRQAAEAVRSRIDWKYLLGLELTDPGFDSTVLSEFRTRLVEGSAERRMLDAILELCRARKWLAARGRQRTDSTHVLGMIRALHRLECAGETMRHALDSLAVSAPDWLRRLSPPEWLERYGRRFDDYRLPKGKDERQAYAEQIGADGYALLDAIYAQETAAWLRQIPALEIMRQVWVQQFYRSEADIHWRTEAEGVPPSALFIASPYDPEAHFAKKRSTSWVGYKVHLTESCEENQPHLITHVETTAAPVADGDALETIHDALAADDLLPAVHLTDTGYVDAKRLLSSRTQYDVDLLGPTRGDYHRRGRENKGFAAQDFTIDWERHQAICPAGQTSANWVPTQEPRGKPVIRVNFASSTCKACPHRLDCIDADGVRRTLTLQMPELQIALQAARHREKTAEFREQYGKRAGIEGTISQGVRAFDLRRSRYIGSAKTHLQHLLIAAAVDLSRIYCWLVGEPRAQTRQSAFTALMMPKAA